MLNDHELLRYSRQIFLEEIGISKQLILKKSRVMILGLGGIGSPVALYLASSGVGELHLVDTDKIDLSNLQRQILYNSEDIGKKKVDITIKKLSILNPEVKLVSYETNLNLDRLEKIIGSIDLILDCSDNFATRDTLNIACVAARKPLISAAAINFHAQLCAFDSSKPYSPCYNCLYGSGIYNNLRCSESGVISPIVGVVGSLQALEAIKILVGAGTSFIGRLLLINTLDTTFKEFKIERDLKCTVCSHIHE